jgi:hypothetical protein
MRPEGAPEQDSERAHCLLRANPRFEANVRQLTQAASE